MDTSENEFDRVIREIDRRESDPDRHLSLQLDAAVRDCIRSARASGEKATLKLTITITPDSGNRMTFAAKHAETLPRPANSAVTLYADAEGGIHNSDPAQMKLPLTKPTAIKKEN
jgi:hypothetical protein